MARMYDRDNKNGHCSSARPLPAVVALSPIAERPPFVSQALPPRARFGDGFPIEPIEKEDDLLECRVPRRLFGAGQEDEHPRVVWVFRQGRQKDRMRCRIAVTPCAVRQEARVIVGPQALVQGGDRAVGGRAHHDTLPCLVGALEKVGQRLIHPTTFEMMESKLAHSGPEPFVAKAASRCQSYSAAGPTRTKVRSDSVAISPRLTPPGTCSSVLPAR